MSRTHVSATATDSDTVTGTANKSDTQTGYVLGGGFEHALTPSWSVKAEYQYMNLGSQTLTATGKADGGEDVSTAVAQVDNTYHTVRVGLNYHVGNGYEPLK